MKLSNNMWVLIWVLALALCPFIAFLGGYAYTFVLLLTYFIFQTIMFTLIKGVGIRAGLWFVQLAFVMLMMSGTIGLVMYIVLILYVIIGEALLWGMFRRFGNFFWGGTQVIFFVLVGSFNLFKQSPPVLFTVYIIGCLLTGLAIKYGYLVKMKND